MIYDNIRSACAAKHKTITEVLKTIGRSTGLTGNWKNGVQPRVDVLMDIADNLGITLDELCYGKEHFKETLRRENILTADELEWLSIFSAIPDDRRQVCVDFLRTHAAVPARENRTA